MITSSQPLSGLTNYLIYDGLLNHEIVKQAAQKARTENVNLIHYLVKNNILRSEDVFANCKKNFDFPSQDLQNLNGSNIDTSIITPEFVRRYHVLPLGKINNTLQLGISDPTDKQTLDTIAFYTGLNVTPIIILEDQLTHFIQTHFNENSPHKKLELGILKDLKFDDTLNNVHENVVNYDEPVIRFVDHLIQHAHQQTASDIHIEPYEKNCRIRYRQDGLLYEIAEIPIPLATRVMTRIKVMAKLDISERRLPQDGRIQMQHIDIRMNTCPTLYGEKIVLRLLDAKKLSLDIKELGLEELQQTLFFEKISQPQGLILVTGPTGCGKTVTLYSALNHLNTTEKNILTVEDPVEIQLNGVNQVHINPKINFNFANALRSFLRQDPDIIMVGEIRDNETAEIALQAAQTGHLVLSTLHTNNALEAITRLRSMGIASYNIISSLSLIIAQRLIRKLCIHCKQVDLQHPKREIYRAVGCQHCLQGYQGRIGIYEFLPITENLSQLILSNANANAITTYTKNNGFVSLRESGLIKVNAGITSLAELNRVVYQ